MGLRGWPLMRAQVFLLSLVQLGQVESRMRRARHGGVFCSPTGRVWDVFDTPGSFLLFRCWCLHVARRVSGEGGVGLVLASMAMSMSKRMNTSTVTMGTMTILRICAVDDADACTQPARWPCERGEPYSACPRPVQASAENQSTLTNSFPALLPGTYARAHGPSVGVGRRASTMPWSARRKCCCPLLASRYPPTLHRLA